MTLKSLAVISLILLSQAHARSWRSSDGSKSFFADYISHKADQITLRRSGQIISFPLSKLHADDKLWLDRNHPLEGSQPLKKTASANAYSGAAFGPLDFGDSQETVLTKLNASDLVKGNLNKVMLARVGLDGVFQTTDTIGGLHCELYFDWDTSKKLREVILRTKPQPAAVYESLLKRNWSALISLISDMHGKPLQGNLFPSKKKLEDGLNLSTHLWKTATGHSVLLGAGQDRDQYTVVVRISAKKIEQTPN